MGRPFRLGHIRRRGQVRGGDETVWGRGQYCVGRWGEGLTLARRVGGDRRAHVAPKVDDFGHIRRRERIRDGDGTVWRQGRKTVVESRNDI